MRPAPARRHDQGHRQQLRDRFLERGAEGMPDYELLVMLLFFSIRYIDMKPLAKRLPDEFGSLGGVLAAEPVSLEQVISSTRLSTRERPPFYHHSHQGGLRLLQRALAEDMRERPVIA